MKKPDLKAKAAFLLAAVLSAAADLLTKAILFDPLRANGHSPPQHVIIENFFYIRSAGNEGGVFGMLQGETWTLVAMAALALAAVLLILLRLDGRQMWMHVALGLVLGGAAGNLYDRLLYLGPGGAPARYVRDFLDFKIFGWDYPIFNGADVFICVGAGLIFLRVLFGGPLAAGKGAGAAAAKTKAKPAGGQHG